MTLRAQAGEAVRRGLVGAIASGRLPDAAGAAETAIEVSRPASPEHGDLATNLALRLAKPLRMAPSAQGTPRLGRVPFTVITPRAARLAAPAEPPEPPEPARAPKAPRRSQLGVISSGLTTMSPELATANSMNPLRSSMAPSGRPAAACRAGRRNPSDPPA